MTVGAQTTTPSPAIELSLVAGAWVVIGAGVVYAPAIGIPLMAVVVVSMLAFSPWLKLLG